MNNKQLEALRMTTDFVQRYSKQAAPIFSLLHDASSLQVLAVTEFNSITFSIHQDGGIRYVGGRLLLPRHHMMLTMYSGDWAFGAHDTGSCTRVSSVSQASLPSRGFF